MKNIIFFALFFLVTACAHVKNEKFYCESIDTDIGCEIPFIKILVNPINYDNKKITTTAYIVSEKETHYMVIDPQNMASVSLFGTIIVNIQELDPENLIEGGLYMISGVFDYKNMQIKSAHASFLPPLKMHESLILAE